MRKEMFSFKIKWASKYIGEEKLEAKNHKPLAKPHSRAIANMEEAKVDNVHRTPPYNTWVEGLQGYQRASAEYCHKIDINNINKCLVPLVYKKTRSPKTN